MHAQGIVLAAERCDRAEPINVGSGQEITIREVVELIAEVTGFTGEIRRDPSKPEGSRGERSTSGGRGGFLGQWHASRSETD